MTTTTTLSKQEINQIPQMLSSIPDDAFVTITINIEPPIEMTKEYQEASNLVDNRRKTPHR
jgi:hypothetical protein